jgi:hypothetical protein
MSRERNGDKPQWYVRRRIITSVLIFDALVIAYSLYTTDIDAEVAKTAISAAFTSGSMVIGSYVFGAVWNDKGDK